MTEVCETPTCTRGARWMPILEANLLGNDAKRRCSECCGAFDNAVREIAQILHDALCPESGCRKPLCETGSAGMEYINTAVQMVAKVHDGHTARQVSWQVYYQATEFQKRLAFEAVNRALKVHEALTRFYLAIKTDA